MSRSRSWDPARSSARWRSSRPSRGWPRCGPSPRRGSSASGATWSWTCVAHPAIGDPVDAADRDGPPARHRGDAQGTREAGGARDPVGGPGPRAEQSRRRRPAQCRAPAGRPGSLGGGDERAGTVVDDREHAALVAELARRGGSARRHAGAARPARRQRPRVGAGDVPRRTRRGRCGRAGSGARHRRLGSRPPRAHRGGVPGRRTRPRRQPGSPPAARSTPSSTRSRPVPDGSPRSSRRSRSTPSWTRPRSSASTSAPGWTTRW